MAKVLILAAAAVYMLLAMLHATLTLKGNALTPNDDELRRVMQTSHLRLDRSINLWDAWIGFNLSHSLSLLLLGGGLGWLALWHYPVLIQNLPLQAVVVGFAVIYLILSLRFWFRVPSLCLAVALALLVAGFAFQAVLDRIFR